MEAIFKKLKQISKEYKVPIIVNDMKGITSFVFKNNHQKLKLL